MSFSHKNFNQLGTTIAGSLLIASSLAYLFLLEKTDYVIFFGLLGTGISLCFLPDTLFNGIKSFINKNKDKEI